ncbi:YbaB/EbfC family DNA-binding protein [Streptosporangium sp. NPDC020145]|uniref:YbaB/EbfC family DNA-binding protein n=1 Tax=unclassified Streptosporangium TaxID=2632669 RepID=UPI0034426986
MTAGFEDFDRFLEEARRALDAADRPPSEDEPPGGRGTAADGRIVAEVSPDGLLSSLRADPRVMRMGLQELCDQVVHAVNAALNDLRSNLDARHGAVDVTGLTETLGTVQEESMRRMNLFVEEIGELARRIEGRG